MRLRAASNSIEVGIVADQGQPAGATRFEAQLAAFGGGEDHGSCPAAGYNLLFGNLENVASHSLTGGRCGLGSTGSYAWTGVPQGNLFFLVVGTNGMGTESSWGRDSEGLERQGDNASGACLVWQKNTAATCP